jgi:hypothetical protein
LNKSLPISNFETINELGFIKSQQHLLTEKQVQSFVPDVLIGEDVVVITGEQPLENPPVELVLTLQAGVVASAPEELNEVEPCFGLLGPFNELDEPVDVLLVGKLGHVVEEHLEQELRDVGALVFLPITGLAEQLRDDLCVFL